MNHNNNNNAEGCDFCRSQSSRGAFLPCVFCTGKKLRTMQQKTATVILRRMGFAARESFDLHCAALKAAIHNNDNGGDDAKEGVGGSNHSRGFDDETSGGWGDNAPGFVNGVKDCPRRLATMAAAFFGDGVNVITREEFDAHRQMLAAAEAKMQKRNNKKKGG